MRQNLVQNSTFKTQNCFLIALLCGGLLLLLLLATPWQATAQSDATPTPTATPTLPPDAFLPEYGQFVEVCEGGGIQSRPWPFEPQGFIITTFSRDALWIVDLGGNSRYPLPESRPCGPNCLPSPDRRYLLYVSPNTRTFWMMNVDGTGRHEIVTARASSVNWWDDDHWLVWSAVAPPYMVSHDDPEDIVVLDTLGIFSVQPGGMHALRLMPGDLDPVIEIVDMETGESHPLTIAQPYFNGAYWSPDGTRLAYIGYGERDLTLGLYGAELYLIQPGQDSATRLTDLTGHYGAVRIAGELEERAVSWSPDGRYLAFWVMEIIGRDIVANVGHAVIHILDTASGQTRIYCGFATNEHAPNPPSLVWSPDSRYIAFGVDEPDDGRASLLIILDPEDGTFTEVSEGMYAAYGNYDPIMWGER